MAPQVRGERADGGVDNIVKVHKGTELVGALHDLAPTATTPRSRPPEQDDPRLPTEEFTTWQADYESVVERISSGQYEPPHRARCT